MNRRITFLCICLLATFALQAQTFTGKVVDEKKEPAFAIRQCSIVIPSRFCFCDGYGE